MIDLSARVTGMELMMLLDRIPLWIVFIGTISVVYAAIECGYHVGRYRRKHSPEREAPVGAMVGAMLGLLAFVLAFSFGLAASRFDERRRTVVEEANAIGTTYLRASLLPPPQRPPIEEALREYVSVRLRATEIGGLEPAIARSIELHNELWNQASAAASDDTHSIMTGLFIQSLNELIDIHSTRMLIGVRSRIPPTIWIVLYFVSAITMATMGYSAGLAGSNRSVASIALVIVFSSILLLIVDLDRPLEGLLRVSQQAMLDLQQGMAGSNAGAAQP